MPFAHVFEDTVVTLDVGEHRYRAGGPYSVDEDRLAFLVSQGLGEECDADFVPPPPETQQHAGKQPKQLVTKSPKGQFALRSAQPKTLTIKSPKGEQPKDDE